MFIGEETKINIGPWTWDKVTEFLIVIRSFQFPEIRFCTHLLYGRYIYDSFTCRPSESRNCLKSSAHNINNYFCLSTLTFIGTLSARCQQHWQRSRQDTSKKHMEKWAWHFVISPYSIFCYIEKWCHLVPISPFEPFMVSKNN